MGYLGALHQALLDLSNWVEKGIAPPASTCYTETEAQINLPAGADERAGIQPVVTLKVNGAECAQVKVGQSVQLNGVISVPRATGKVRNAEWDFEEQGAFMTSAILEYINDERSVASTKVTHEFTRPGIYYPVLRATSRRDDHDPFTNIRNLARVRVVVTE